MPRGRAHLIPPNQILLMQAIRHDPLKTSSISLWNQRSRVAPPYNYCSPTLYIYISMEGVGFRERFFHAGLLVFTSYIALGLLVGMFTIPYKLELSQGCFMGFGNPFPWSQEGMHWMTKFLSSCNIEYTKE